MSNTNLEEIVSLCKRRGFIYQGSEIYGGLAGTWDYGPLGLILKNNITELWWDTFVDSSDDMYGIESTILMNTKVWEASGHIATFSDLMVVDLKTKKPHKLDQILEDNNLNGEELSRKQIEKLISDKKIKSPDGNDLGQPSEFNTMFQTSVGTTVGEGATVYLRPETAQGMFVNFKNVVDSFYPDLPFGLAQIGRNFRNEISPRDFIFRVRELEIMELEYFINPKNWQVEFKKLEDKMDDWFTNKLGLSKSHIHQIELTAADRAHYSDKTIDFEYKFPIGLKEIAGLAYRSDFDLSNHQKSSGKSMEYILKSTNEKFIPHVIEPTFGVDRHVLAVISEAYTEDKINGENRIYLAFPNHLAPIKIAVFPLLKNKPELTKKARGVYELLRKSIKNVMWDDNGNIGKRYRRQDEIGTPYCVTIDFTTLEDNTVTLRERDSTLQKRISIDELQTSMNSKFKK